MRKQIGKRLRLIGVLSVLFLATSIGAIEKATVELQGWGGVNFATKSTYSTDFTDASYIQPTFGITAWASQPFLLPNNLDLGLSVAYMPIFTQTASDGKANSVTSFPITAEARYRFPMGFFAAAGGGYAYTRFKANDESSGTNAAIALLKGGYQYEIMPNLSLLGTVQASYFIQKFTFPGSLEKSNSQFNFGIHVGVSYKI